MKNIFILVLSVIILCIFAFTFIKVNDYYNISFEYADNISAQSNNNTVLQKNIIKKPSNDTLHLADINSPENVNPILNKINEHSNNYISIIIDDSGNTLDNSDRYFYLANEYNITFAVLPDSYHSTDFSYAAYSNNVNIILHIPMEGRDYFGEQTLIRKGMNEDEVFKLLDYSFSKVPYANGMNNHTGSVASCDESIIAYMLSYAKNNDKYFVDSYTVSDSLIYDMALEYGVKTARRSVFLDNERDYSYIMKQWRELIKLSKEYGIAVGIGHYQSEETLKILEDNLPLLEDEGIMSVNITEILN
ncbi:divergent polysaccharide deacetylase family protein [Brachyspira hyodysenteriae]|uniref:divergent polysaccharide deacetylase family protein n=1 Tax=Brachyspira hyodysenteriae TaxID=159 RepID=UPI002B2638F8|nr:divergent polysaccharide deacetylase family protein [Brachyspira hyodysenteriae]WPC24041.1 divergent polysaccharide deacetylase family protein [Brachyspira hyodysenteriae]